MTKKRGGNDISKMGGNDRKKKSGIAPLPESFLFKTGVHNVLFLWYTIDTTNKVKRG
ncbi:MAG: hypothetical protein SNJ64_03740 [Endomicrobiia bacterium]